ncbi:MAG TPA: acyltransferase [Elusimicrobiota bacterium]|nr:acyltransferase [Elusimicrobiota bacterium]
MTRTTDSPPLPRSPRYRSLDIWRGLACLMVVVYHSTFYLAGNPALWRGGLFRRGIVFLFTRMWMGVPIFFVISGYCISATCDGSRRRPASMARYLQRRLRRIYPPYLVFMAAACAVFAAMTHWNGIRMVSDAAHEILDPRGLSWVQWLGNLTLTDSWLPLLVGKQRYFMMQAWSLCYEEQFYAVCGLILLFSPRKFFSSALWVSGAVLAVALLSRFRVLPSFDGAFFDGRWLLFAMGVALYYSVNYGDRGTERLLFAALASTALAFLVWGLLVHDIGNDARQYGIAAAAAAAMLLLHPRDAALMESRALNPVRFCGEICYSLYLVHWPICLLLSNALDIAGVVGFWQTLLVVIPVCAAASILGAWLFHHYVERRFLNAPLPAQSRSSTAALQPAPYA